MHSWFGKLEKRPTPENLSNYLDGTGSALREHYGLRCIVDYLADNNVKLGPSYFAGIKKSALAPTDCHPYYPLAQLFQLIV